jgi:hypothetical protein
MQPLNSESPLLWPEFSEQDLQLEQIYDRWLMSNTRHSRAFWLIVEDGVKISPLLLTAGRGERLLTAPGANERDFRFYGGQHTTVREYALYLRDAIIESAADHVKLPLLSRDQATQLEKELSTLLTDFRFAANLVSVIPLISKRSSLFLGSRSLKRASRLPLKRDWEVRTSFDLLPDGVEELHASAWGENRGRSFFNMLSFLIKQDFTEPFGIFRSNGELLGFQVNIRTSDTFHYYYSVFRREEAGAGSAAMGLSYQRFLADDKMLYFSFGRGSERYKYRHANEIREVFELRGFYMPL